MPVWRGDRGERCGQDHVHGIVTGKTRPNAGTVTFGERAVSLLHLSEAQIARIGVGRKFQRPTVFEDQSVHENLLLAVKNRRGPFAVLFWRPKPADLARVQALAAEVGLADVLPRKAGGLSHGQKQWLEIGMLLAQEPAAGMTLAAREATTRLLVDMARTRAEEAVEHDMGFVRRLNCRVTVLHEGEVLAEASLDHVTKNQAVIDVYLGR